MNKLLDAFTTLLESVDDVDRPGLVETPKRAAAAWAEKTRGYSQDINELVRTFETEAKSVSGMIVVRDIAVESICEHHLERVWGYAHVAYVPLYRVLGLSKFYRIVDAFARRLQLQERLTADIADFLMRKLQPRGVGIVIEARHSCMEARGINQRGQVTTTSELRGCILEEASARAEFLALARTAREF